jgi:ssDNA-binding Zn-finger/Zn-ribbon topoisomerase 1
MKNSIAITVIVGCLIGTALIALSRLSRRSPGAESIPAGEQIWMQCAAKGCASVYQMPKREYYLGVEESRQKDPRREGLPAAPSLACAACEKPVARRAVKCDQCDHLFPYGLRQGRQFDYADRCPKCDYSAVEKGRALQS